MTRIRSLLPAVFAVACILGAGVPPAMGEASPAPAPAQAPLAGRGQGLLERMAERLQLTDAQRASCKEILARHQDALAAKGQAARAARAAWFEALRQPGTPAETLKALHRTQSDLEFERLMEGRTLRQELHAVLTPAQREQAARMEGRREGLRLARAGWPGRRHGQGGFHGAAPAAPDTQAPANP